MASSTFISVLVLFWHLVHGSCDAKSATDATRDCTHTCRAYTGTHRNTTCCRRYQKEAVVTNASHGRLVRMTFNETLKTDMQSHREFGLAIVGIHRHTRFYEFVMYVAFPIFTKLVLPFTEINEKPPRIKIYMSSRSKCNTYLAPVLQQIVPEFDFDFQPWMPCLSYPDQFELNSYPVYVVDNEHVWLHRMLMKPKFRPIAPVYKYRLLAFRKHVLATCAGSSDVGKPLSKHLFLSRPCDSSLSHRCMRNEGKLVPALNKALSGPSSTSSDSSFAVVQFEHMPFGRQVAWFSSAQFIIGQHGAGITHCLWMSPRSTLVEIKMAGLLNDQDHFSFLCNMDFLMLTYMDFVVPGTKKNSAVIVPIEEFIHAIQDRIL
jgi:hypothetical protein